MTIEELTPYFGTRCQMRLRCRGCGGRHTFTGTPRRSAYIGDFVLKGYTFSVEDVEQVWRPADPPRGRRLIPAILLPRLAHGSGSSRSR